MPIRVDLPAAHPHVAVVTLDRAEKANALDPQMLSALADAWRRVADDDSIRCAILTASGCKVFCAGMDMTTTIPAPQKLSRGEKVSEEEFTGLRKILPLPLHEAYERQELIGRALRKTEDAREAQKAFIEKRKPVWKGR